jgi:predicted GNAT superfamily acetyltransferase
VSRTGPKPSHADPTEATTPPPTAIDLGFAVHDEPRGPHGEAMGWSKRVGERGVTFRLLRRLPELLPVDGLQREVFGVSDLDLLNAGELVSVSETGGDVIGAFVGPQGGDEELVGFSAGWGGYYQRRPRIVSEFLAVRADVRSLGLGADLKRLQAAIALERGFVEMVWTVDPLRAANARLNFEKLGAFADRYEENRYGEGFAVGLYGGLPTDRLHVTWPITSRRVRDRLLGQYTPLTTADVKRLRHFDPFASGQKRALVYLPSNIDLLVARDPNAALRWRLTLRETLQRAFAAGFAITGFVPDVDVEHGYGAYVIEKDHDSRSP